MNAQRALDILHTLADGTDPYTGADFPPPPIRPTHQIAPDSPPPRPIQLTDEEKDKLPF